MKRPEKPRMIDYQISRDDFQSYQGYLKQRQNILGFEKKPKRNNNWTVKILTGVGHGCVGLQVFTALGAIVVIVVCICAFALKLFGVNSELAYKIGSGFAALIAVIFVIWLASGFIANSFRSVSDRIRLARETDTERSEIEKFELYNCDLIERCTKWAAAQKIYDERKARWDNFERQKRIAEEETKQKKEIDAENIKRAKEVAVARKEQKYWLEMGGLKFEKEFASILRKNGFNASVTTATADEGIDIVGTWYGEPLVVQCKAWKEKVSSPSMREFLGSWENHNGKTGQAFFAGLGGFTDGAKKVAKKAGIKLYTVDDVIKLAKSVIYTYTIDENGNPEID